VNSATDLIVNLPSECRAGRFPTNQFIVRPPEWGFARTRASRSLALVPMART
jgi:hypothetical protein